MYVRVNIEHLALWYILLLKSYINILYIKSILYSPNLHILYILKPSELTSNKMKLGIAMLLIASLSAALLTIPSKVAMAQTSPEDQTMQGMSDNKTKIAKAMIAMKITQIRSNHPILAAVADKIQTMDAKETLKNLLGVEILGDLLKLHAKGLIMNQTAGNQTTGQ